MSHESWSGTTTTRPKTTNLADDQSTSDNSSKFQATGAPFDQIENHYQIDLNLLGIDDIHEIVI